MKSILVINCGSSSLKYQVFDIDDFSVLSKGRVENIGEEGSNIKNHEEAALQILEKLASEGIGESDISIVGHRVVHGGEEANTTSIIDEKLLKILEKNSELAPLHNPANIQGIKACMKVLPEAKQVAVFDTAFHATIPEYAYHYGLPYEIYEKHKIRKYGFHGTSHAYVAGKAAEALGRDLPELKLITVHLGSGASIAAIDHGKCIDTSMGFSPISGLFMGTRPGDLDASAILYLMQKENLSVKEIDEILNKKSGMLGIYGISNDMREVKRGMAEGNKRAQLAYDMFLYSIKKYLGSYLYILGGADAIVFTATISERDPEFVAQIVDGIENIYKNPLQILTIPTDEELMIAKICWKKAADRGN